MRERTLGGRHGRVIAIDVCEPCQGFWFDGHESLQLAPAAVLSLFQLICTRAAPPQRAGQPSVRCPRCRTPLRRVKDMQRSTPFEYLKCPRDHGRFIAFLEFLKKKDFLRPLTPAELTELRQHLQSLDCVNCGAAVDVLRDSQCSHCGTPLSILDVEHAQQLVEQLRDADR